jgi:hypothetical protein
VWGVIKALLKQPYWVIALVLGTALVALPCITFDKSRHWTSHPPTTLTPVAVGIALLSLSAVAFCFSFVTEVKAKARLDSGLDLSRVHARSGEMWTTVSGCEIRVVVGRIEDQRPIAAVALPCNEYFDDRCIDDTRSALGAYVNHTFEGNAEAFVSLVKAECRKRFTAGSEEQKTDDVRAESFGPGKCILLEKPLGRSVAVALVATTTQRAGQGLAARIAFLFEGMNQLFVRLADARFTDVTMPVLGAGHGRIDPPLALVGLLLAIAEAARYGQGGQRLRKVTIVVFKRDKKAAPEVDPVVVRRALALVGSAGT